MRKQTFYDWLERELFSARLALLTLYESRDRLLYVEAPELRRKYMDSIGVYENPVLEAELEAAMLRRKAELLQSAVNRRETIDLEAIDARLEEERQQKVSELEEADLTLKELPDLSEEQERQLQKQYREITGSFHPAMNPDISDTQKELYEKAVEAYKMQDVEALKTIHGMLFAPNDQITISYSELEQAKTAEERRQEYGELAAELGTDYLLAKELYASFAPLEDDQIVLNSLQEYREQREKVEEEIERIRSGFPFNAEETMNSPEKKEEYLAELRIRAKQCEAEKAELEKKINDLLKGQGHA